MIQNRGELKGSGLRRVTPAGASLQARSPSMLSWKLRQNSQLRFAARYSDPLHPWLLIPAKINGQRNGSTESAEKVLASKVSDLGGRSLVRYGPAVDTGSCVRRGTCEAHSSRLGLLESQGL